MVLDVFGGMGVGGNARKRVKCQAGQCLMGIGIRLETDGKKLEIIGKDWRTLGDYRRRR